MLSPVKLINFVTSRKRRQSVGIGNRSNHIKAMKVSQVIWQASRGVSRQGQMLLQHCHLRQGAQVRRANDLLLVVRQLAVPVPQAATVQQHVQ